MGTLHQSSQREDCKRVDPVGYSNLKERFVQLAGGAASAGGDYTAEHDIPARKELLARGFGLPVRQPLYRETTARPDWRPSEFLKRKNWVELIDPKRVENELGVKPFVPPASADQTVPFEGWHRVFGNTSGVVRLDPKTNEYVFQAHDYWDVGLDSPEKMKLRDVWNEFRQKGLSSESASRLARGIALRLLFRDPANVVATWRVPVSDVGNLSGEGKYVATAQLQHKAPGWWVADPTWGAVPKGGVGKLAIPATYAASAGEAPKPSSLTRNQALGGLAGLLGTSALGYGLYRWLKYRAAQKRKLEEEKRGLGV